MAYGCKILADSINGGLAPNGTRLTTMQVTFPRIVLAEFNTHRQFSRNSASSRAIPVEKQLKLIQSDPFIPVYWGKNQKGMVAEEELTPEQQEVARVKWLAARDSAVQNATNLLNLGIHKQITNRLLEPFMWHTVIVTATEWENFFNLRCSPEAQPEIQIIAKLMKAEYEVSKPTKKYLGDWHLPLIKEEDHKETKDQFRLAQISCARCARVSYLTHDGLRSQEEDLKLHDRLLTSGHMSPFEHAAFIDDFHAYGQFSANFRAPWKQYRKLLVNENNPKG